jgi:hypothetical protein
MGTLQPGRATRLRKYLSLPFAMDPWLQSHRDCMGEEIPWL